MVSSWGTGKLQGSISTSDSVGLPSEGNSIANRRKLRHKPLVAVETKNLKLMLHGPEHLRALLRGEDEYARASGFKPAPGLKSFFFSGEVSPEFMAKLETATETDPWTHGFAIVHLETATVIGACGFKGPPNDQGMVEIAYGLLAPFQGKGYATEAAQALLTYAAQDPRVMTLRAHTLPQENASTRVLTKCGFHKLGEVTDPEDGPVWRWERERFLFAPATPTPVVVLDTDQLLESARGQPPLSPEGTTWK